LILDSATSGALAAAAAAGRTAALAVPGKESPHATVVTVSPAASHERVRWSVRRRVMLLDRLPRGG
jgi:hypothetical protein